jgi:hypothetical protein
MSSIKSIFLESLLAFPANTLDKKTIKYIFNLCYNKKEEVNISSIPKHLCEKDSKCHLCKRQTCDECSGYCDVCSKLCCDDCCCEHDDDDDEQYSYTCAENYN